MTARSHCWRLLSEPRSLLGVILVGLVVVGALLGPALCPYRPDKPDFLATLAAPSAAHLLGTDDLGRDVLARILHGARVSLMVALGSVVAAFLLGAPIGLVAGYAGGWTDSVLMRCMDVLLAFPGILLTLGTTALLVAAPLGAGAKTLPVLTIGVVSDPVTLDPAFSASFFETQVLYNLHETLLVIQPDGTVTPGLASIEMIDPTYYRLTLRDGLTFHDGTALDAAAAKANIDRFMDPATGSIRRADFGLLKDIAVSFPRIVELTLSAPYAPLPLVLTNRAGMMVSPTAVAALGPDFTTKAVGCGPWKLASWTKNSELVVEAFPGYWQDAPKNFARLVYRPCPTRPCTSPTCAVAPCS